MGQLFREPSRHVSADWVKGPRRALRVYEPLKSLSKRDSTVVVDSWSAGFVMLVISDIALGSNRVGLISIVLPWVFGLAQQRQQQAPLLH